MCLLTYFVVLVVLSNSGKTLQLNETSSEKAIVTNAERTPKVIGGSNTNISSVPYQLSLEFRGNHTCGASILNERFALSAAHCVVRQEASYRIRSGSSIRGTGGTLHNIVKITTHEKFRLQTVDYDIAIIEVLEPFVYSSEVQPIALTTSEPSPGQTATLSGWGSVNQTAMVIADRLQKVKLPIVSRLSCLLRYALLNTVTQRMICAGDGSHESCKGDSGGPLVIDGKQVGIVSWGAYCGRGGFPGVYTNVGNAEIQKWIKSHSQL